MYAQVVCGITSRVSRYCARHEVRIRGQALRCPVPPTVQGSKEPTRGRSAARAGDSCQQVPVPYRTGGAWQNPPGAASFKLTSDVFITGDHWGRR